MSKSEAANKKGGKIGIKVKIWWGLIYAVASAGIMLLIKIRDHAAEQIWPEPEEDED